ncbi:MAG: FBP domain-containing protein [Turicibacter sp.]
MAAFLKKQEYNYINRCLNDLNHALRNCNDYNVRDASRDYIQDKIMNHLSHLIEEEKMLLDISELKDSDQIKAFMQELEKHVYGMRAVSNAEMNKIFKKEKKLKVPDAQVQAQPLVYLGWLDYGTQKLYVIYPVNGQLLGMAARITEVKVKQTNVCTLCNHMSPKNEVAFVSPRCKGKEGYRTIGFHICLDSAACNERITSTQRLETILKDVNNIK